MIVLSLILSFTATFFSGFYLGCGIRKKEKQIEKIGRKPPPHAEGEKFKTELLNFLSYDGTVQADQGKEEKNG